ncbi:hypothetical protein [Vulcanisaeta distributa]|uniref:hypothetical protein n=1 Tax=Vulcanisaeta distributa TaxID=164451 RepID=UPI0006CF2522|nr:hypothetical protein [Vulcanisaeta distributa]
MNELEGGVVKDVVESGGLLIIYGPHGIGKSTLVRYVLAKILRESGIKAVIDLNGRSSREVSGILATADGLRYTLLYDHRRRWFMRLVLFVNPSTMCILASLTWLRR